MTPPHETTNQVTAYYDRNYGTKTGGDDYKKFKIDPEAVSKGYKGTLEAEYGPADISRELMLNAIRDPAMARDVTDFWLSQWREPRLICSIDTKWRPIQTAPGQHFSFASPINGNNTYRINNFMPDRAAGRISIEGVICRINIFASDSAAAAEVVTVTVS
jgi:hypothetical protein